MAMTGTNIPAGWHYDAFTDSYKTPGGDVITRQELNAHHGSIDQVLVHRAYDAARQSMAANVASAASIKPRAPNSLTGAFGQITNGQIPISNTISNGGHFVTAAVAPAPTITMQGKLGNITINLDTGDLTIPPNVGRDDAIRDFWLGFQKYYQPTNKAKYEQEIQLLKNQIKEEKKKVDEYGEYVYKEASKKIADKFREKYGGQKLIMVKPGDLAKFLEDA